MLSSPKCAGRDFCASVTLGKCCANLREFFVKRALLRVLSVNFSLAVAFLVRLSVLPRNYAPFLAPWITSFALRVVRRVAKWLKVDLQSRETRWNSFNSFVQLLATYSYFIKNIFLNATVNCGLERFACCSFSKNSSLDLENFQMKNDLPAILVFIFE